MHRRLQIRVRNEKKANDLVKVPIVSSRADLLEARRDGIGLAIVTLGRFMLSTHDGKRKRKRGNLEKVSIKIHYCAIPYAKMLLRKDESLRAVICRLEVYKYRRTRVHYYKVSSITANIIYLRMPT